MNYIQQKLSSRHEFTAGNVHKQTRDEGDESSSDSSVANDNLSLLLTNEILFVTSYTVPNTFEFLFKKTVKLA